MTTSVEHLRRAESKEAARVTNIEPSNERFVLSATVSVKMRQAVEALFFFNPRQPLLRSAISVTVERTGVPKIVKRDGRVSIDIPGRAMQCLFACDSSLKTCPPVAVALYERPTAEVLSISHLAVDPAYSFRGKSNGAGLGLLLIERVMDIARRIKGVKRVQLPYREECFLRVGPAR